MFRRLQDTESSCLDIERHIYAKGASAAVKAEAWGLTKVRNNLGMPHSDLSVYQEALLQHFLQIPRHFQYARGCLNSL